MTNKGKLLDLPNILNYHVRTDQYIVTAYDVSSKIQKKIPWNWNNSNYTKNNFHRLYSLPHRKVQKLNC